MTGKTSDKTTETSSRKTLLPAMQAMRGPLTRVADHNVTWLVVRNDAHLKKLKSLGALFDKAKRAWYIPAKLDKTPFRQWIKREVKLISDGEESSGSDSDDVENDSEFVDNEKYHDYGLDALKKSKRENRSLIDVMMDTAHVEEHDPYLQRLMQSHSSHHKRKRKRQETPPDDSDDYCVSSSDKSSEPDDDDEEEEKDRKARFEKYNAHCGVCKKWVPKTNFSAKQLKVADDTKRECLKHANKGRYAERYRVSSPLNLKTSVVDEPPKPKTPKFELFLSGKSFESDERLDMLQRKQDKKTKKKRTEKDRTEESKKEEKKKKKKKKTTLDESKENRHDGAKRKKSAKNVDCKDE
jgi:hypothetical protein